MPHSAWPALPLADWRDTCQTLHLWTQIVGKIRLTLSPKLNHWWGSTLYVNARGLTTSPIPYRGEVFEIQFDFITHQIEILHSAGARKSRPLTPEPVAAFYEKTMSMLQSLNIQVAINTKPQELPDPVPFEQDYQHGSYDPEYAHRFWRILLSTALVLEEFRACFIGKCSPVQFFWGSFDLACTRFSGRRAPARKGVISSEAYSHEVISAGFWPGSGPVADPAFYSYTAPQPPGLENEAVRPHAARWNRDVSEFILMYDDVRKATSPAAALMDFLESTYEAGAKLANWDRGVLERDYRAAGTA